MRANFRKAPAVALYPLVKCHSWLFVLLRRLGIHTRVGVCLIPDMFQPDLFAAPVEPTPRARAATCPLTLPGVLRRLTDVCERPRYSYMVLNLIAQASSRTGSAGPYVREGDKQVPIREWLCDALMPIAHHNSRRAVVVERVRADLFARGSMPADADQAEMLIQETVDQRLRHSALTNVSRAVSELVRAGLVRRHYQGYRVDHHNRGAQRQAVYTVTEEAIRASTPCSPELSG